MQRYWSNRWFKAGVWLAVLGCGPLLTIITLAALHLWPDRNPNPIGPGLLFMVTAWPAIGCLAVGTFQVKSGRGGRRLTSDSPGQSGGLNRPIDQDAPSWRKSLPVRYAAGIAGVVIVVQGISALMVHAPRPAAAAIVVGVALVWWAAAGSLPDWLTPRRRW